VICFVSQGREATESRKEEEERMRHPLIPVDDIPARVRLRGPAWSEVLVTMLNGKLRVLPMCACTMGVFVLKMTKPLVRRRNGIMPRATGR
jgi:hypothetical protein